MIFITCTEGLTWSCFREQVGIRSEADNAFFWKIILFERHWMPWDWMTSMRYHFLWANGLVKFQIAFDWIELVLASLIWSRVYILIMVLFCDHVCLSPQICSCPKHTQVWMCVCVCVWPHVICSLWVVAHLCFGCIDFWWRYMCPFSVRSACCTSYVFPLSCI